MTRLSGRLPYRRLDGVNGGEVPESVGRLWGQGLRSKPRRAEGSRSVSTESGRTETESGLHLPETLHLLPHRLQSPGA